jgi:mannose-6-phosphate isomerase-like protein (cupin superfamily)
MTYPETRYHAATGAVSATYRAGRSAPDFVYPNGTTVHYLATGAATEGLFGLYRWEMGATAGGPGPHFHRTITESFYVLRGAVQIYDGRDWIEAGPDDFVHVPVGGIHGFRNASGRPASMLIHFAPGAPREAYFEGLVRAPGAAEPTAVERAAFYREHDNEWV